MRIILFVLIFKYNNQQNLTSMMIRFPALDSHSLRIKHHYQPYYHFYHHLQLIWLVPIYWKAYCQQHPEHTFPFDSIIPSAFVEQYGETIAITSQRVFKLYENEIMKEDHEINEEDKLFVPVLRRRFAEIIVVMKQLQTVISLYNR